MRSYDFTFGFCIPNSTNSWEAIYDVPPYTSQQIAEYVSAVSRSCMAAVGTESVM